MLQPPKTVRRWLSFIAFICVLTLPACDEFVGCGSLAAPVSVGIPPKPTPTPNPNQTHLYVADERAPGHVYAYLLPIVADSDQPTATVNVGNSPFGIDLDANGKLYVANDQDNSLFVYNPPIATGSIPTSILSPPAGLSDLAVQRSSGELFVGSQNQVGVYMLPVSTSSTAAFTMTSNLSFPHGVGFDDVGNLWIAEQTGRWEWFQPPFSSSSSSTQRFLGFDPKKIIGHSGQLFVAHDFEVDVYTESTQTLVFALHLPAGADLAEGEAFDAAGNFYVAVGTHVYVYGAPVTAASQPLHTLTTPSGHATNLAIGM